MDNRPRLLDQETGAFYPIATFEDLAKTLSLMERGGSNIRQYITEFYTEVILPLYKSKEGPHKDENTGRVERRLGIFTTEIVDKFKEVYGTKLNTEEIRQKYLYPLVNQGIMDKIESETNYRDKLWFPVDEDSKIFTLFNSSDNTKLKVKDHRIFPDNNTIEQECITLRKYSRRQSGKNRFIFLDPEGMEIGPKEVAERYFGNPELCFEEDWEKFNE